MPVRFVSVAKSGATMKPSENIRRHNMRSDKFHRKQWFIATSGCGADRLKDRFSNSFAAIARNIMVGACASSFRWLIIPTGAPDHPP
jgi:hypothetical protein